MKKKHIFIWLAVLAVLLAIGVAALHPAPRYFVRGWMNGESYFQGRPTSYWADLITGKQEKPFLDDVCDWLGLSFGEQPKWAALAQDGDPQAIPVLRALLQNDSAKVREMTCRSLQGLAERTHDRNLPEWKAIVSEVLALEKQNRLNKAAVFALVGEIGPPAAEAVPLLEATINNPKERLNTRLPAAAALLRLNPQSEAAVAVMVDGVQSQNDRTSAEAIHILCSYISAHPAEVETMVKPHYPAIKTGVAGFLGRQDDDGTVNLEPAKELLRRVDPATGAKGGAN